MRGCTVGNGEGGLDISAMIDIPAPSYDAPAAYDAPTRARAPRRKGGARRLKALWRRLTRSGFARALVATPFTSAFLSLGFEGLGYVLAYLAATFLIMVWLADNEKAKRGVNIAGNVAFLTYGVVMGYWVVIALNIGVHVAWHILGDCRTSI